MSLNFNIGQGETPLQLIPSPFEASEFEQIALKREDLNPTGSHKDRGVGEQIKNLTDLGHTQFVISSSGNAAISAIEFCKKNGLKLHIFLAEKLSGEKNSRLMERLIGYEDYALSFSKKPLSDAIKFSKLENLPLLRGSTDHGTLRGYMELSFELINEMVDADAIFIPASSGTLAAGIYEGYQTAIREKKLEKLPQFHIVQTSYVNTLVRDYDKDFMKSEDSIADSIVDRVGHRYRQIQEVIKNSEGYGWVVNDNEIEQGVKLLSDNEIVVSNEAGMTIAALEKAIKNGWKFKKPICILTGTRIDKSSE